MFASQLLRILQTIPSDVKYEICVFDSFEQDMTMMEDHNRDSKNFARDSDSLSFGSKGVYHLNDSERETGPLAFDVNVGDERWNPFAEDFSMSNEIKTRDSPTNENRMIDKEPSMKVEELAHSLYTDKNVLECQLPEFVVCYKEINYHIVKDICVDEGVNVKDKISVESCKDDESDQVKEDESQLESSLDKDTRNSLDSEDSKEELSFVDKKLPFQEFGTRSFLRSFISSLDREEENKVSQPPDQISSSTEEEPNKDFQANSLLYNSEVQRGSITFNFNSPAQVLASVSTLESEQVKEESVDVQDCTSVNEKVNGESVDLQDLASANEEVNQESVDVQDHKSANEQVNVESVDLQDHTSANEQVKEESVDVKDHKSANDDNISISDAAPPSSEKNSIENNMNNDSLNHSSQLHDQPFVLQKDGDSYDISAEGVANEPKIPNEEHRNSGEVSVRYEVGETSFSAAGAGGHITYSGPIAYSGSLSIRSDGSTASSRSFAFPILPNEWNSSPVRMAKADRKQFRKHKCWRSGLLCFRF